MSTKQASPFTLPKLPYADNALQPYISSNTISFHYGKHHNTYVTKLNELVANNDFADMSLEDIIKKTYSDSAKAGVFNNAAQVWNHTFYWNSLSPKGGGKPSGDLGKRIDASFGTYDNFIKEFSQAGITQFGSGWAWLIQDGEKLKVTKTPNAVNPMCTGQKALLTIDVWEHAYYLDYQNKRPDYIAKVLDKLINWQFAEKNLQS